MLLDYHSHNDEHDEFFGEDEDPHSMYLEGYYDSCDDDYESLI